MGRIVKTSDVAKTLGVSIYRVNQLINEPCRVCGSVSQWTEDGEKYVEYQYGKGCKSCRYTGRRLPTIGRLHNGKRAPHLIDEDVLEEDQVKNRVPGYPEGKERTP